MSRQWLRIACDTLEPEPFASHLGAMSLPKAPVAAKHHHIIDQLGRRRIDDYAWMKDDNWQQVLRDPKTLKADVREHLDAENAYTTAVLAPTEALQAALFAEMKGRIKEDDSSVPSPDGRFDYYTRYALGAEHPVHARRPRVPICSSDQLLASSPGTKIASCCQNMPPGTMSEGGT